MNMNMCLLNMKVAMFPLGRTRFCYADDNQCLYILKEVERRVIQQYGFQNMDTFDFQVVRQFGVGVNANNLLNNGRDIQITDVNNNNIFQTASRTGAPNPRGRFNFRNWNGRNNNG